MSTTHGIPDNERWTDPAFAPPDGDTERLAPYTVEIGDRRYSQRDFLEPGQKFVNFTGGVGSGKTAAGIMRLGLNVEEWSPGELHMVITPTSVGLKNAILPELAKFGFLDAWEYHSAQTTEPGLHAPNGARVILESADNQRKIQRIRGPNVASIWIDEPQNIHEDVIDVAIGRLRVGNYRNLYLTGTPAGKNWVWRKFVNEDSRFGDVRNVLAVPSYANPHLPLDYRRDILDEYEGNFYEQEVLGKFVSFEGLVYAWFGDEHVVDELPGHYDEVIYGVDWGHNNPAAVLAIVRQGDRWIVADEWYERRCTAQDHARAAEDMVDAWGPGPLYCDPSEPANIEAFKREDLDARAAENDVIPGIQKVSELRDRLRVAAPCQSLRNEFNQYQYRNEGEDDRPVKQNDHALDALRYALFTHLQPADKRGSGTWGGAWQRRRHA